MKYLIGLIWAGGIILALIIGAGFYLSPQDKLTPADAIVVVSGGETNLRVEEGVRLFERGLAPLIIMSGAARDEGVSNALAMKQIAVRLGVPDEAIIIEEEAQTTLENAQYVRDIVEENQIDSLILVTSPYHQRRAYLSFQAFLQSNKVTIINHSATDSAWRKNGWWQDDWGRHLTVTELQKIVYLPIFLHIIEADTDAVDENNNI